MFNNVHIFHVLASQDELVLIRTNVLFLEGQPRLLRSEILSSEAFS